MEKMLSPQGRRLCLARPRPRTMLLAAIAAVTTYILVFNGPSNRFQVVPYLHEANGGGNVAGTDPTDPSRMKDTWDFSIEDIKGWRDPDDREDPKDIEPGYETDGQVREPGQISKTQHEKDLRTMWRYAYKMTAK